MLNMRDACMGCIARFNDGVTGTCPPANSESLRLATTMQV